MKAHMHFTVKQFFASLAMVAACAGALAAGRPLPQLGLEDERALAVAPESLAQNRPWVLIVVDPDRTLTPSMLAMLERTEGGWDDTVVVLVVGDEGALARIKDEQEKKLAGVRWYRSTDARLTDRLKVPGLPVVLGIDARQQIAWQSPGLPANKDQLQQSLNEWLFPNARAAQNVEAAQ